MNTMFTKSAQTGNGAARVTLQGSAPADATWKLSWCDVGGVRTRYSVAGEVGRPAIVLLHGIGLSLED